MDAHDDMRRETSSIAHVGILEDAADLDNIETCKKAKAIASMSMRSGTRALHGSGIKSAIFEFLTSAFEDSQICCQDYSYAG